MGELQSNWECLWRRTGASGAAFSVFSELTGRYAEPHRVYHNLTHLEDCLRELAGVSAGLVDREAVEFALWFHDAVYDPKAGDNEERSAALAVRAAESAGLAEPFVRKVEVLILATKRHEPTNDPDTAVMLDVDLSILGQPAERFDRYETEIRTEYAWVPEELFRTKRAEILAGFLARSTIYQTGQFRKRYEDQARTNLQRSIQRLSTTST